MMSQAWFPLVLVAFGLMAGTLSGVLGVGGGIFVVPFLVLVGGLDQQSAQATSLAMILPTAIVATVSLTRKGVADPKMSMQIGILGAAAGLLGTYLALSLPGATLRVIFAVLLALVGIKLLRDSLRTPTAPDASDEAATQIPLSQESVAEGEST
jgi:uncharacterized membrane protein YfcA